MKCNYKRKKDKPLSKEHQQMLSRELARIMIEKILPKQIVDERYIAKQEAEEIKR